MDKFVKRVKRRGFIKKLNDRWITDSDDKAMRFAILFALRSGIRLLQCAYQSTFFSLNLQV